MSTTITDAAVEAAARAMYSRCEVEGVTWEREFRSVRNKFIHRARCALEGALPHIENEEITRLRAEADALRVDADALARVREIVRLTQKSVSDAYETACHNGDGRGQTMCLARASLLNNINAAMGADA